MSQPLLDKASSEDPLHVRAETADAAAGLSTAPTADGHRAAGRSRTRLLLGPWRRLTSMRTALVLLALVALAAIPGSLLPQRNIAPARVAQFIAVHPTAGPLLDRLGGFAVFASPWFAATYLLLIVSLVGCLVPRLRLHIRALRATPPTIPRHLDRLPAHASWRSDAAPEALTALLTRRLRRHRWRVVRDADGIRAERGYSRETGNLLFHVSLLLLLGGIAWGSLDGYQGDVVVVNGQGFSNTQVAFDTFNSGPAVDARTLPPFTLSLRKFTARYLPDGQPADYSADVRWQPRPGAAMRNARIVENHPLVTASNWASGGTKVYLTGHGFAPVVTVTDKDGDVVFRGAVPFLPREASTYTSDGVIKVPAATPDQLAFRGFLLPTAQIDALGMRSVFPGPRNPRLVLTAFHGNLGLGSGQPQSVYTLNTTQMRQFRRNGAPASLALAVGQTWRLPDGRTLRFDRLQEFANFHVTYNPGKRLALLSIIGIIVGLLLSLRVRRRRLWIRVHPHPAATGSLVVAGGLARSDNESFTRDFTATVTRLSQPPQRQES